MSLIILFDQFSRNIYRGTPQAFMNDEIAYGIVDKVFSKGDEEKESKLKGLPVVCRHFMMMPFMHREEIAAQKRGLEILKGLLEECREAGVEGMVEYFEGCLEFGEKHCEVIRKFGRFPHRNKALSRESSREEREYLEQGGATWGQ